MASATLRNDCVAKLKKQVVGDGSIIGISSFRYDTDVRTGPSEAVHFAEDDPARLAVEAKIALDGRRKLNCPLCWQRLTVRNGNNVESHPTIFDSSGYDDHDRSIFQTFFVPSFFFVRP